MEGEDVDWSKQGMIKRNAMEKEDLLHWEEHRSVWGTGKSPGMGWV